MPDYTPKYAFPSPTLAETPHGPNNLQDLAVAVETKLATMPLVAMGTGTFSFVTQADKFVAVTFPVGRVTATPSCAARLTTSTFNYYVCSVSPVSTTGATFYAVHYARSATTVTVNFLWMAVYAP